MGIPFIDLKAQQARIRDKIDAGLAQVLDHGGYILGPEIGALETRLGEWSGAKHNISCSSGTDALLLALHGLGLKPGEGVIVPSFTFAASAEVMPVMGAVPVFAEVDPITFNLDAGRLDAAMDAANASGVKVVGIIGVGLFGQPADLEALMKYAVAHDLWLIDDAAQSFGASWQSGKVGSLAHVTCTSFFPAKPLGCYGDGGAVFTDNDEVAQIIRSCRVHGMGKDKYQNVRIGMTGRLDTMQAVVLDAKLDIFAEELELRQQIAERYHTKIGNIVEVPRLRPEATSSWAQYTIKLPDGINRDDVCASMNGAGVPTAIYYPVPMHRQGPYTGFPVAGGSLEGTDSLSKLVMSLPMHPYLEEDVQNTVVSALKAAL
ncbi:DegT/DnrJ/EryC1/StrS aminotransferase family protein [Alphaproteobacteria bacterium]|nr:DegT/DnrJ/EryC1/StrS aminotransferase family protein [Alphaproteobacteria bacterium]